jgi:hypothetical protein
MSADVYEPKVGDKCEWLYGWKKGTLAINSLGEYFFAEYPDSTPLWHHKSVMLNSYADGYLRLISRAGEGEPWRPQEGDLVEAMPWSDAIAKALQIVLFNHARQLGIHRITRLGGGKKGMVLLSDNAGYWPIAALRLISRANAAIASEPAKAPISQPAEEPRPQAQETALASNLRRLAGVERTETDQRLYDEMMERRGHDEVRTFGETLDASYINSYELQISKGLTLNPDELAHYKRLTGGAE